MSTETTQDQPPAAAQVDRVVSTAKATPPPNPFYKRTYASTITGGQAWVEIPSPGNTITPEDAQDLIEFFELIQRQLQRIVDQSSRHVVV